MVELAVTLDAGVQHLSVEGGADVDRPRPVLRHQGQLEGGEVWLVHVQQAPALHAGLAALPVVEADGAHQHAAFQVQFLAEGDKIDGAQAEPGPAFDAKGERQPIRDVDQVFVLDDASGDVGAQAIVHPGHVGAGVVHVVSERLVAGTARGKVAVPEGAQGLARAFVLGHEVVVNEFPRVHQRFPDSSATRRSRKTRTSSVSPRRKEAYVGLGSSSTRMPMPSSRTAAKASSSVRSSPR